MANKAAYVVGSLHVKVDGNVNGGPDGRDLRQC